MAPAQFPRPTGDGAPRRAQYRGREDRRRFDQMRRYYLRRLDEQPRSNDTRRRETAVGASS